MSLEAMDAFFNKRADTYDDHMLVEMQLNEFYEAIAGCFPESDKALSLLDLGCGTGLELERLFERMPNLNVTGIDLSKEMLSLLQQKFPLQNLQLICDSYFDVDFGENQFDFALTTYSLHHFSEGEILALFKKVYGSLRSGGVFIEGDYTCETLQEQEFFLTENKRLRNEFDIIEGYFHYDTPFTVETHIRLLKNAGFSDTCLVKGWDSTSIVEARK